MRRSRIRVPRVHRRNRDLRRADRCPTAGPWWTTSATVRCGGSTIPAVAGNLTGGEGGFAVMDSDFYGPDGQQDTELVSPIIDLSGVDDPVITFNTDYLSLSDTVDVDLSIDGGATWTNVWRRTADLPRAGVRGDQHPGSRRRGRRPGPLPPLQRVLGLVVAGRQRAGRRRRVRPGGGRPRRGQRLRPDHR